MDDVRLTSLFQQEFEWCRVRAGESVVIVTEPASPVRQLVEPGRRGSATISGHVTDDAGD